MPKSKSPKTFFKQVPLKKVKEIAKREIANDETNRDDAVDKRSEKK
jgi:hypothetical protein